MRENRTSIQPEPSVPPWERPGGFRLDSKPHRATLLNVLAFVGLSISGISIFYQGLLLLIVLGDRYPLWDALIAIGHHRASLLVSVPLALGIPLSLMAWWLSHRDLDLMRKGLMDPSGKILTRQSWFVGLAVFTLDSLLVAFYGTILLVGG